LTLYPIERVETGNGYNLLIENIDKNFEDILLINDKYYKTKYMFADFGHGANNMDNKEKFELVIEHLIKLVKRSKFLEEIYYITKDGTL
jgi:hypothetical protein